MCDPLPGIRKGAAIYRLKMKIVIDTREQLPIFTGPLTVRKKLLVGDYSSLLLYNHFSIERKSPQDLYGTVTQGHVRFREELIRAEINSIDLVVFVESTMQDFIELKFPQGHKRKMKSSTLQKIIETISLNYRVEFVWLQDRVQLCQAVYSRLHFEELHYQASHKKGY